MQEGVIVKMHLYVLTGSCRTENKRVIKASDEDDTLERFKIVTLQKRAAGREFQFLEVIGINVYWQMN